jgi:hypothetical protein
MEDYAGIRSANNRGCVFVNARGCRVCCIRQPIRYDPLTLHRSKHNLESGRGGQLDNYIKLVLCIIALVATSSQAATVSIMGIPGVDYSTPAASETTTGNRTFTGTVSASGATSTKPFKSGTIAAMPATCAIGDTYYATDATARGL